MDPGKGTLLTEFEQKLLRKYFAEEVIKLPEYLDDTNRYKKDFTTMLFPTFGNSLSSSIYQVEKFSWILLRNPDSEIPVQYFNGFILNVLKMIQKEDGFTKEAKDVIYEKSLAWNGWIMVQNAISKMLSKSVPQQTQPTPSEEIPAAPQQTQPESIPSGVVPTAPSIPQNFFNPHGPNTGSNALGSALNRDQLLNQIRQGTSQTIKKTVKTAQTPPQLPSQDMQSVLHQSLGAMFRSTQQSANKEEAEDELEKQRKDIRKQKEKLKKTEDDIKEELKLSKTESLIKWISESVNRKIQENHIRIINDLYSESKLLLENIQAQLAAILKTHKEVLNMTEYKSEVSKLWEEGNNYIESMEKLEKAMSIIAKSTTPIFKEAKELSKKYLAYLSDRKNDFQRYRDLINDIEEEESPEEW